MDRRRSGRNVAKSNIFLLLCFFPGKVIKSKFKHTHTHPHNITTGGRTYVWGAHLWGLDSKSFSGSKYIAVPVERPVLRVSFLWKASLEVSTEWKESFDVSKGLKSLVETLLLSKANFPDACVASDENMCFTNAVVCGLFLY